MGVPKQTMPYGERTMTAQTARTMLAADLEAVVVVTRTELVEAIDLPRDDRLLVAINDDSSSQMMDSIRIGLDSLNQAFGLSADAGILVIPADMPTVPPGVCRQCVEAFRQSPTNIVIATCEGRRGHPIVFPAALRQTLGEIEGGLNELSRLRADLIREIAIDDLVILRDVDTQADYDKLGE